jgi:serine/threonine protein kinase
MIEMGKPLMANSTSSILLVKSLESGSFGTCPYELVMKHLKKNDIQFFREKLALRLLDHKHVIKAHEFYEIDNPACMGFTMERLNGPDLHDRVAIHGPLGLDLAGVIGRQMASAVSHIHSRGVIHRDLKPENVVLRHGGMPFDRIEAAEVCIIDFGLSAANPSDEELRVRCGTPGYVAPEVLMGFKYSNQVDYFSLGCVMWYTCMGRGPFVAKTTKEILNRNLAGEVNFSNFLKRTEAGEEVVAVLMELLEPNPSLRGTADCLLASTWSAHLGLIYTMDRVDSMDNNLEVTCSSPGSVEEASLASRTDISVHNGGFDKSSSINSSCYTPLSYQLSNQLSNAEDENDRQKPATFRNTRDG